MKRFFESETDSLDVTRQHFAESLRFPFLVIAVIWVVHFWQLASAWDPAEYGIIPWRSYGLRGIVTGPLVHGVKSGDWWSHIASNTFPLLVLTWMLMYFYRRVALQAFFSIYVLTGVAVWLFAYRPISVSHIGASGVIYGLVAFIFWNGIFRRSLRSIILSLIVMLLYSGMFLGVLPDQEGISWESHLLGGVVGIVVSFYYRSQLEEGEDEHRPDPFADERNAEKEYFLPRDVFEKTKAQRLVEEAARRQAEQDFPPFWNRNSTF